MTRRQALLRIAKLRKLVKATIDIGFTGKDETTREVNAHLATAYVAACTAFNAAHKWLPKS